MNSKTTRQTLPSLDQFYTKAMRSYYYILLLKMLPYNSLYTKFNLTSLSVVLLTGICITCCLRGVVYGQDCDLTQLTLWN
jgi:hypothetical protein